MATVREGNTPVLVVVDVQVGVMADAWEGEEQSARLPGQLDCSWQRRLDREGRQGGAAGTAAGYGRLTKPRLLRSKRAGYKALLPEPTAEISGTVRPS